MRTENELWLNERREARAQLINTGVAVAEMNIVMQRLIGIFGITATIVSVEDHPEYRQAQARLNYFDGPESFSTFGAYEEQ